MKHLSSRTPGIVMLVGQSVVVFGSDRFDHPAAMAALLVVAAASLVLRSRDVLGLAAAVLLGSAASAASGVVVITGCVAAVGALVLSSVLERAEAKALGVWVALGAVCAALAFTSVIDVPRFDTPPVDDVASERLIEVLPADEVPTPPRSVTAFELEQAVAPEVVPISPGELTAAELEQAWLTVNLNSRIADGLEYVPQPGGGLSDFSSDVRVPDSGPTGSETSWWLALLLLAAGFISLSMVRRVRSMDMPLAVVASEDDHWGRLQTIARRDGLVRRPSESVLDFVARWADKTGDMSVIGIGDLISAELYGESSPRRAGVINRWLNLRDEA